MKAQFMRIAMTLASGRERTMTEFVELLKAAGFQLRRVITPSGSLGISIIDQESADLTGEDQGGEH